MCDSQKVIQALDLCITLYVSQWSAFCPVGNLGGGGQGSFCSCRRGAWLWAAVWLHFLGQQIYNGLPARFTSKIYYLENKLNTIQSVYSSLNQLFHEGHYFGSENGLHRVVQQAISSLRRHWVLGQKRWIGSIRCIARPTWCCAGLWLDQESKKFFITRAHLSKPGQLLLHHAGHFCKQWFVESK